MRLDLTLKGEPATATLVTLTKSLRYKGASSSVPPVRTMSVGCLADDTPIALLLRKADGTFDSLVDLDGDVLDYSPGSIIEHHEPGDQGEMEHWKHAPGQSLAGGTTCPSCPTWQFEGLEEAPRQDIETEEIDAAQQLCEFLGSGGELLEGPSAEERYFTVSNTPDGPWDGPGISKGDTDKPWTERQHLDYSEDSEHNEVAIYLEDDGTGSDWYIKYPDGRIEQVAYDGESKGFVELGEWETITSAAPAMGEVVDLRDPSYVITYQVARTARNEFKGPGRGVAGYLGSTMWRPRKLTKPAPDQPTIPGQTWLEDGCE